MRLTRILLILLLAMGVFATSALVSAQDEEEDELVMATGTITFEEDGDIVLQADEESFVIAPSGAFVPANLESGMTVTIVGSLLPDEETIMAFSLEVEEEAEETPEPEATEMPAPEVTETPAPEVTEMPEPEMTEEPASDNVFCDSGSELMHPAGARLANNFDVEYETVMDAFCNGGLGFGEIMRVLAIAETAEGDAEELLMQRADGTEWNEMLSEHDLHPRDIAPGRMRGNQPWDNDDDEDIDSPQDAGSPDNAGPPDHAGPPDNAGPPDHAGPPDNAGPPDHAGPPDNAGPPDHAGPPDNAGPPNRDDEDKGRGNSGRP